MPVISSAFDPGYGTLGGVLIGGLSASRLAASGRLSGMDPSLFIPGVLVGGILIGACQLSSFDELKDDDLQVSLHFAIGGVLVGTGVAIGQG